MINAAPNRQAIVFSGFQLFNDEEGDLDEGILEDVLEGGLDDEEDMMAPDLGDLDGDEQAI